MRIRENIFTAFRGHFSYARTLIVFGESLFFFLPLPQKFSTELIVRKLENLFSKNIDLRNLEKQISLFLGIPH